MKELSDRTRKIFDESRREIDHSRIRCPDTGSYYANGLISVNPVHPDKAFACVWANVIDASVWSIGRQNPLCGEEQGKYMRPFAFKIDNIWITPEHLNHGYDMSDYKGIIESIREEIMQYRNEIISE